MEARYDKRITAVHPRASGEHYRCDRCHHEIDGSSPRERGTPPPTNRTKERTRFIPARAGNTGKPRGKGGKNAVHPRASGEHAKLIVVAGGILRFIPARAGNTSLPNRAARSNSVHPRASGEHRVFEMPLIFSDGSSPRERGTQQRPR